jgi:polyisoprenoid-binding protein YceI
MISRAVAVALFVPLTFGLVALHETSDPAALRSGASTSASLAPTQDGATRFVVAPTGNEANYRVQERITTVDIPNYEAVGKTQNVSGAIVVDEAGRLVPGQSKIVIDVTTLKSDQERRDGYVQRRLLETETYPTVEFVPTAVRGLNGALPTSGSRKFQLVGNLTVKGVTRPTTWDVTAQFDGETITGSAATRFTFADFELKKPSVSVILTLADELKLEYRFTLAKAS